MTRPITAWITLLCPNHPNIAVEVLKDSDAWCSKCGTRMVEVGK